MTSNITVSLKYHTTEYLVLAKTRIEVLVSLDIEQRINI